MALGKGLGAILEDIETSYKRGLSNGLEEIDISKIKLNPFQPRKEFDEKSIKELAESIKSHGLMQPVVVIRDNKNFILVAGERRVRACKMLGKKSIKAIIVDYSLKDLREYALIENIQRENLSAVEVALSLKSLIKEHNYTHEEVAKVISKSRSYVTNLLRILNLPSYVLEKIEKGVLSFGHAKILLGLSEKELEFVVKEIEEKNLSVRETEALIRKIKNKTNKKIEKLITKFGKLGLDVEGSNSYFKIKIKNDKDLEKLEKLLAFIS